MIVQIDSATFRNWAASGGITIMREIPRPYKSGNIKRRNLARLARIVKSAISKIHKRGAKITSKTAAELIGVCEKTVYRWTVAGIVPRKLTLPIVEAISSAINAI